MLLVGRNGSFEVRRDLTDLVDGVVARGSVRMACDVVGSSELACCDQMKRSGRSNHMIACESRRQRRTSRSTGLVSWAWKDDERLIVHCLAFATTSFDSEIRTGLARVRPREE